MNDRMSHATSPTLLARLRDGIESSAWDQFVPRYGKMIRNWCLFWGLQSADAEDIVQDVLLDLSKQMPNFQYDQKKSFRAWLKTVAYRTWCDYLQKCHRRRDVGSGDSKVLARLDNVEARESFREELEKAWKRELLEEGMRQVKGRVHEHTWEAFRLMTQDGLSGAEVASRLGMKVGAVWVAKSKVQKLLQEEIKRLEEDDTEEIPEIGEPDKNA